MPPYCLQRGQETRPLKFKLTHYRKFHEFAFRVGASVTLVGGRGISCGWLFTRFLLQPDLVRCLDFAMCPQERTSNRSRSKPILFKSAILFLLLAVGALSTFTRVSQYYPQTASIRYVTIANKMKVVHPPALIARMPLQVAARMMAPQPAIRVTRRVEPEVPFTQRIGIVVCLQHRSPPSLLA
jgi:hypothetical protein